MEVALQPLHPSLLVLQRGAQVGGAVGELDGVKEGGGGRRGPLLRVLRAGWGATERAESCHWQVGRAEMNFVTQGFQKGADLTLPRLAGDPWHTQAGHPGVGDTRSADSQIISWSIFIKSRGGERYPDLFVKISVLPFIDLSLC